MAEILDFSASINPLGPPEWLRPLISRCVSELGHYPDPHSREFVAAVAGAEGIAAESIVPGNGVSELLPAVLRACAAARVVVPSPAYGGYAQAARQVGCPVVTVPLRDDGEQFEVDWPGLEAALAPGDVVLLGRPNNPTGGLPAAETLRGLAVAWPAVTWVVDEAFIDFVEGVPTLVGAGLPNLLVLRSLTKFYAIPGLRLGYAAAVPEMAASIRAQLPDWSVNTLAQAVGARAVADIAYGEATRRAVAMARTELAASLTELAALTVYRGSANFLLLRLGGGLPDASELTRRLLTEYGIAVRDGSDFDGLDGRWLRVAVRTAAENEQLVAALAETLGRPPRAVRRRRAHTLMFQGTSSHAGKSWMTTALCRILLQDGVRVAPFKAQNMSNNSFVARDGGEMGRAQVLQAQACRLDPETRMNPILLKPNRDTGAQVIVRGHVAGDMSVWRYDGYKEQAARVAHACFDELAAEFDAVILEGAGSPGEVNLKHRDIVNMAMARHAQAPVLLVGDIDRGGVYASFVGTMEVLAEWERRLLRGFVVNKFRGDAGLLGPAHDYVLAHTGVPVVGVVPYLGGLNLPEEDSVGFGDALPAPSDGPRLDVVVVDLPHVSNFNDVDPLRLEPDVALRVVRTAGELGTPDVVLLPGTKNTLGDLAALRSRGLADAIAALADAGTTEIVGLCGGFQMLGETLADPHHLESSAGRTAGLGLLAVETVMEPDKVLCRVAARHEPSGEALLGYEIHHGRTAGDGLPAVVVAADDGRSLGVGRPDGRVWGTYLHGLFDADGFRRWWLDRLRERRGWPALGEIQAVYDLEPALDRLADTVRQGLDMDTVYRLLGL